MQFAWNQLASDSHVSTAAADRIHTLGFERLSAFSGWHHLWLL